MALFGALFTDVNAAQFTPPQNPFSTSLSTAAVNNDDEDPDDWEYEYSTTETETYYVTLDLTTPDIEPKRKPAPKDGRMKTRWVNPGLGRHKRGRIIKPPTYSTVTGVMKDAADEDIPGEAEAEEEEVDDEAFTANADITQFPQKDESDESAEVQILDLHTSNPLVSYDGNVYSCQWANNIGTELLFTAHERDSPIPKLRTLPGGVDLLAASSARLISNHVELEPRERQSSPDRAYKRGSQIDSRDLAIPLGRWASVKRKDQASFLEKFIEIKEDKGETDLVTVVAQKRLTNSAWRQQMREKREKERKKLQGIIKKSKAAVESQDAVDAKKRLQEMDEEDARRELEDSARGRGPDGKKRRKPGRKNKGTADGDEKTTKSKKQKRGIRRKSGVVGQVDRVSEGEEAAPDFESMAAETPRSFGDEVMEYSQIGDGLHDEDAPGEEEDTHMQFA